MTIVSLWLISNTSVAMTIVSLWLISYLKVSLWLLHHNYLGMIKPMSARDLISVWENKIWKSSSINCICLLSEYDWLIFKSKSQSSLKLFNSCWEEYDYASSWSLDIIQLLLRRIQLCFFLKAWYHSTLVEKIMIMLLLEGLNAQVGRIRISISQFASCSGLHHLLLKS
jgi:hypothetical protein